MLIFGAVSCLKSRSKVQAGKKILDFIIKLIIKRKNKTKEKSPPALWDNVLLFAFRGEQNDSFVFA